MVGQLKNLKQLHHPEMLKSRVYLYQLYFNKNIRILIFIEIKSIEKYIIYRMRILFKDNKYQEVRDQNFFN